MRLQQWIKNLFLFAALVFSVHLFQSSEFFLVLKGFFLFSLVSSGVYIFNDITDLENDKLHPTKSQRPLPSGKLSVGMAYGASVALWIIGLVTGFFLKPES